MITKRIYSKNSYTKEYASFDEKLDLRSKKLIRDSQFHFLCDSCDKLTGGVYLKDYEWVLLDEKNPWKKIYSSKEGNCYKYILNDEDRVILRGAKTYYYLLAYKGRFNNVDKMHIVDWLNNYAEFFRSVPWKTISISNNIERKCFAGLLDNIRNYFLVILNMYIIIRYTEELDSTILLYYSKDSVFKQIFDALSQVYKLWIEISVDAFSEINCSLVMVNDSIKTITNQINELITNTQLTTVVANKCFKSHRECDSFWENILTLEDYFERHTETTTMIGVLFGGIETPLIAKSIYPDYISDIGLISLEGFFQARHNNSKRIRTKAIENVVSPEIITFCDDNILTGKTADAVLDYFGGIKTEKYRFLIIRRTPCNRIFHILSQNRVINTALYPDTIDGLLFTTQYTKIKAGTNIYGMYLNELYHFDYAKEHIYKLIYLNGLFNDRSRVNKFYRFGEIEYEYLSKQL